MNCACCWIFAVGLIMAPLLVNKSFSEWAASTWWCWFHRAAKSSCRHWSFFFLFFFSSPVRSYQDGIWETLDKIDAGLVKYWSSMAQTSGLHLDHVVAGERQAMMGRQQANAAWRMQFFIVLDPCQPCSYFQTTAPIICLPTLERAVLIFTAWFGEFNEEAKALEARWRGNEGGFI